jgi:hypothetical protein
LAKFQSALIDPPNVYATLQTWEDYLVFPEKLPEGFALREELIAEAREVIAEKKAPKVA